MNLIINLTSSHAKHSRVTHLTTHTPHTQHIRRQSRVRDHRNQVSGWFMGIILYTIESVVASRTAVRTAFVRL